MTPEEIRKLEQLARENGILPLGNGDEIAAVLNSQRPKIRLPGDNRELGQFAREVGEILSKRDLFRRDLAPVVVNAEKQRLDVMTSEMLRTWAEQHLVCFKDKQLGNGENSHVLQIVKTMNVDTARGTLASTQFLGLLPEIERVNPTRLPVLRQDGRIELLKPGYFAEGRVFTLESGLTYDEEMTIERAKEILAEELLGEMPFHDDGRSRSVQLAAMVTVFCASLLPRRSVRPGFVFTANDSDAGKTLAAKIAIIPVHGKVSPRGLPRKEEMRKVLDQIAMEAQPVILFDNVKGTLGGEDIEAFMSAALWQGRILGEKGGFEVENVTICFFSGNDCKPTRDMAQRCLFVELFLEDIDSSKRKIKNFLTDKRLADAALRSKVCSALWALVKHWDAAGRPGPPTLMPKCPEWSEIVCGIVACCGFGDPCAKPNIASARGDVQEMSDLVVKLAPDADVETEEWTFAQIMEEVKTHALFENLELHTKKGESEALFTDDGELTPAARSFFGRFLVKFDQRLFVGPAGERLRWVVQGKGNSRKYLVVREGSSTGTVEAAVEGPF